MVTYWHWFGLGVAVWVALRILTGRRSLMFFTTTRKGKKP